MSIVAQLSPRECAVVQRLVEGRTYQQISQDLGISRETVKTHLKRIRKKLGLQTRTQIAVWGARNPRRLKGAA